MIGVVNASLPLLFFVRFRAVDSTPPFQWHALFHSSTSPPPPSTQELRRDAFALAGERYAELEPSLARLNALETEQRELEAKEAEKRREKKAPGPRGSRR